MFRFLWWLVTLPFRALSWIVLLPFRVVSTAVRLVLYTAALVGVVVLVLWLLGGPVP